MDEPRVPDSKNDWKSIDIYIFSNGQQASPPRKYHLMIDQLEWWKSTLNFLAKAQYGSLHSMIDLYTTDGNKVETPMQLSQDMAYVAVLPPDVFIDAGYGKYLIKATRSWEKGQFRRTSNTAMAKMEELTISQEKSNSATRDYETEKTNKREEKGFNDKIYGNESQTLKTIIANRFEDRPSVIVKPIAKDKSNSNSIKPTRLPMQQTVKRNSFHPSPPRSRKPSLRMKDPVKINTEENHHVPLTPSVNKYPLKSKINKLVQKQRDSLPEAVLTKVEEIVNKIKSNSSLKMVQNKSSETKTTETESLLLDNNVMLLPNVEKDTHNNEKLPNTLNFDVSLSNNVNRQGGIHELFYMQQNLDENTNAKTESIPASETEVNIQKKYVKSSDDSPLLESKLSSTTISKLAKTKNDVTMINKDAIVNMKLSIEISNNPNQSRQVLTEFHSKDSSESLKELKGYLKVEESLNIDEGDKSYTNKRISNTKNESEVKHKIIVVNCASNGDDQIKNKIPVNNGSTNLLVFLPVLKLDEDCKGCRYRRESKVDKGTSCCKISSDYYPAKKTASCLSIHKEKSEKLISQSELAVGNNSSVQYHMGKNEETSLKRKAVAIKEEQKFPSSERIMTETEIHNRVFVAPEPDKTDLLVIKRESAASILHKFSSKFTQTEWCDVLLEVKLQEDGHYSLHMPTLEMLKYYKL